MSEVSKVFERLPELFQKGKLTQERTFYFSLGDDEKWTVTLTQDELLGQGRQDRRTRTASSRPPRRCSWTSGAGTTRRA